jgi:hypothetical protein
MNPSKGEVEAKPELWEPHSCWALADHGRELDGPAANAARVEREVDACGVGS